MFRRRVKFDARCEQAEPARKWCRAACRAGPAHSRQRDRRRCDRSRRPSLRNSRTVQSPRCCPTRRSPRSTCSSPSGAALRRGRRPTRRSSRAGGAHRAAVGASTAHAPTSRSRLTNAGIRVPSISIMTAGGTRVSTRAHWFARARRSRSRSMNRPSPSSIRASCRSSSSRRGHRSNTSFTTAYRGEAVSGVMSPATAILPTAGDSARRCTATFMVCIHRNIPDEKVAESHLDRCHRSARRPSRSVHQASSSPTYLVKDDMTVTLDPATRSPSGQWR